MELTFASRLATPSDPYEVGREAIREFAVALGADDPIHRDPEAARSAGHPDVVAPPTFVVALTLRSAAQVATDMYGNIDMADVLHREQAFTYSRPVYAGDRLVLTSDGSTRDIDGRHVLTVRTEVHTTDGEHVCAARSVIVHSVIVHSAIVHSGSVTR